jgi:cell division protease FtsH
MQLPAGDVLNRTEKQLQARLCVLMAGRIAEMRHTHELSTGASNDIEQATEVARAMVCDYGMSRLGPMSYGKKDEQIFLGREIAQHRDYSEATAIQIDQAVRMMVESAYQRAEGMIDEYAWALEKIAGALLERETMDGGEVQAIIERREKPHAGPGSAVATADAETQAVISPGPEDRAIGRGFVDGESPAPA